MQVCAHAETLVLFDKNMLMLQRTCAALKSSPSFFEMLHVNLRGQLNMSVTQGLSSKLDHEAGCSRVPILLKCELHVKLNVACFILAAAVAAAATVTSTGVSSTL